MRKLCGTAHARLITRARDPKNSRGGGKNGKKEKKKENRTFFPATMHLASRPPSPAARTCKVVR